MDRLLPGLERRLKAEVAGGVHFDRFTRGRYATDASHYQIVPLGVVTPRTVEEAERAIEICRIEGVPVTPRGGGSSQAGQTVNHSVIVDCSKHLNTILDLDVAGRRARVQPGIVLDDLNRQLKAHGLWFPVDVSTASRATIGGMTANNSCGGRSLRYGNTRENVIAIDALLADGGKAHFGPVAADLSDVPDNSPLKPLARDLFALGAREADEIAARFPKVQRRVGGYNIDALVPGRNDVNLAHILVGSEGTLAFSTAIEIRLSPVLGRRAVGACHFGSFHEAMAAAQHIVKLAPIAVELVDATMIGLARDIAMFRPTLEAFVQGRPAALLLVEFAEEPDENERRLKRLHELMGDLGLDWRNSGAKWGGVVDVHDAKLQAAITELRTAGLNIMMSMKEAGKPISFVEDCAVPLEHLADYTARLTEVFEKNGTSGTWYAHASVGCLHVRPILNLRLDKDVKAMRAIAEQAFSFVREYKGSHSGEHGDGLVRSEFHEFMFGKRLVRAFEEVKDRFDPDGLYNPNKIVRAPKFDDRANFRYAPGYAAQEMASQLDWSAYPGKGRGFQGAVEMCNNNGACRSLAGGVMCPSYRVTREERDVTRGRANSLRLAITGQLGPDALTSDEMAGTMQLCVSCKGCRRECPTGVDMARMKIEVQAARMAKHGLSLHDRLVGYLPRYAPYAAKLSWLMNLRDMLPGAAKLSEAVAGFSARRSLPKWRRCDVFDRFRCAKRIRKAATKSCCSPIPSTATSSARTWMLRWRFCKLAATACISQSLPTVHRGRCAAAERFFPSERSTKRARKPSARSTRCRPFVARGVPVVGLEPSCLLELPRRSPGDADRRKRQAAVRQRVHLRGVSGARGRSRPAEAAAEEDRRPRAGARPLPPEGVRRLQSGRNRAEDGARSQGRTDRVELLRHGRQLRLQRRHHRRVAGDGRAVAVARGPQGGCRHADRRRRHLLPPPDP